jgi:hypothetical protein
MNRLHAAGFGLVVLLCLAGCAATSPPAEKREIAIVSPAPSAEERITAPPAAPRLVEDRDLFLEGSALLSSPGGPDQAKAREVFAALIQRYPQSRWRPSAESFISLIDDSRASRGAGRENQRVQEKLQSEITAMLRENATLKETVRELKERLQTETGALIQENEKLKTDLQRLKTLDIELEKRERMLR